MLFGVLHIDVILADIRMTANADKKGEGDEFFLLFLLLRTKRGACLRYREKNHSEIDNLLTLESMHDIMCLQRVSGKPFVCKYLEGMSRLSA